MNTSVSRRSRLFSLATALALLLSSSGLAALPAEPVEASGQWIRAGQSRALPVHRIGRETFLSIEQVARLSDAQVRWQPAAGQCCLSNANGTMCFDWESRAVSRDDRRLRETVALRFVGDRLFVPVRFVTSEDFESFSATRIAWNNASLRLVQDPEVNLRIPQVERTGGIYRLSFDANPKAQPQLIEKSAERIWLRFSRAISNGSQILEGDTVVREVRVNQKRHSVDLLIHLGEDAVSSDVYYEDNKRRLIIDVTPSERARASIPVLAPIPAAPPVPAAVVDAPEPRTVAPVAQKKAVDLSIPDRTVTAPPVPAPVVVAPKARDAVKTAPVLKKSGVRIFVIDAGHGGVDSGAIGVRGTMEKEINLAVARNLARQLRKVKDVRVVMTRDKDEFVPLSQRTAIANAAGADLFVSIHCNSALSSKGAGFETYFLSPDATDKAAAAVARVENSVISLEVDKGDTSKLGQLLASMAVYNFINESSKFAALMCKKVREKSGVEKATVKEADFYVLRGAQMPSVLVELEYLSNPVSEQRLRSSRYQNQLVKGIMEGILTYDRQHRQEQEAYVSQGRDSGRAQR